jgi:hypothetical protein
MEFLGARREWILTQTINVAPQPLLRSFVKG